MSQDNAVHTINVDYLRQELVELSTAVKELCQNQRKATYRRVVPSDSLICSFGIVDSDYGFSIWKRALLKDPIEPSHHEVEEDGTLNAHYSHKLAAISSDLSDFEENVESDEYLCWEERSALLKAISKRLKKLDKQWALVANDALSTAAVDWLTIPDSLELPPESKRNLLLLSRSPVNAVIACYCVKVGLYPPAQEVWKFLTSSEDISLFGIIERDDIEHEASSAIDHFTWQGTEGFTSEGRLSKSSVSAYTSRVKKALINHPVCFSSLFDRVFGCDNWQIPPSS